jgi:hypothetical protein
MTTAAQQQERTTVYQTPNPMDPWDPVKRWYRTLWPAQRVGVWLCCAVIIYLAFRWITI